MKKEIIDQKKYVYEIIFDNSWRKWYLKKSYAYFYDYYKDDPNEPTKMIIINIYYIKIINFYN